MIEKLKNIKLIVIDIDGTLVDINGRIGEKTKSLIKELKKHNILSTLSTARSFHYSKPLSQELNIDLPIINLDGALIKSPDEKVIYKGILKQKIVYKAVKLAEDNYSNVALCNEDSIYITPKNSLIKEYTNVSAPFKEVPSYEKVKDILEVLIYCEDKNIIRYIYNSFKFRTLTGISINFTKSLRNDYYLLILKKRGSDKLKSLKRLVKYLGLHKNNVAVIGDWHNDMPLFDYGGFNIAVQNAIPELKKKADYITKLTNNEDGVGEALELIYNNCVN